MFTSPLTQPGTIFEEQSAIQTAAMSHSQARTNLLIYHMNKSNHLNSELFSISVFSHVSLMY